MARAGRKRKAGKRTASGRLSRAAEFSYDKGTQRAQERQSRFGTHHASALGRAYAEGFLGQGGIGIDRYNAGKDFAAVYFRFLSDVRYRCPLDQTPRGNLVLLEREGERERYQRLWDQIDTLEQSGCLPYLEQLLSSHWADSGPPWLDRMLDVVLWNKELPALNEQLRLQARGKRKPHTDLERKTIHPGDQMVMDAAVRALDILTPDTKGSNIVVLRA